MIKREPNIRPIYECRCDERLKTESEGSTRLTYTGLCGGLEHLKIETRFINERFAPIDGGISLSIRIDNPVFINKTLSTESLINQLLIKRSSSLLLL